MKARDLLAEIKENIKDYDIKYLEERIKEKDIKREIERSTKYEKY